ncbi:MAG TPA: AAA family ATPase [Pirellulales bacterium]
MYEAYWKLERRPFENVADPDFFSPCETHQGALLKIRYAVENQKGAALLAGEHGSGKTMIVEMLKQQLPEFAGPFVHIVYPQMSPADLVAYIAEEIKPTDPNAPQRTLQQSVRTIQTCLAENTAAGRHAVIVIDEAHLIEDAACWDALRLLLNFRSLGRPDATLVIVGQLQLLSTIERTASWDERLSVKCVLKPLSLDDTAAYLQHRLHAAGGRPEIFTPEGVESLYRLSGGLPRRINRLADLALVIGYAEENLTIGPAELDAVCGELVSVSPF